MGALAWGILPGNLSKLFFNPGKLDWQNCSGTGEEMLLDQGKLGMIRKYVFKLYPCGQAQEDAQWRKCIVAIDEYLRRTKGKGNRQN